MATYQAPPSLGFSRQEHWSGLPFPSLMRENWKVKVKSLSHVRPSATPWTAAFQAPPSMAFSRQEYWSGVPLPSPNLSIPGCNQGLSTVTCVSSWLLKNSKEYVWLLCFKTDLFHFRWAGNFSVMAFEMFILEFSLLSSIVFDALVRVKNKK